MIKLTSIVLIIVLSALPAFAAVENLDEVARRKTRMATASWGYSLLQNDANNYTWQPETLNYFDVTTNSEVWQLTTTPEKRNNTQDIAITHWSANGNRLLFHSTRPTNAFPYADGTRAIWMLTNTDGSRLKPAKDAAGHLTTVDKYPLWSPVLPDVFYQGMSNDGQATAVNVLYKVQVSDTTLSKSPFLTITPANTGFISLKKAISADGRKIVINADNKFYPATVYPEASKGFDTPAGGYASALNLDDYWGSMTGWSGYHDRYMTGAVDGVDGVWNLLVPSTIQINGPFWRARLSGSGTNGAPTHNQDRTAPYNWGGEVEPVNTVGDQVNSPSPWCADGSPTPEGTFCIDSPGHGSPDRWGRYLISADPNGGYGYGLSFLDMRTHAYYSTTSFRDTIHNINHPDWEAWSDWSVASGSPSFSDPTSGPSNPQSIVLQKYSDPSSQRSIVYTHARYNAVGSPPYEANARPTQSPDGTKVLFNSTFLNASDSYPQLFWTVAYNPYPPFISAVSATGGTVTITADWDLAGTPRGYTTRGWPNEATDLPPPPREISKFRLWRSTDGTTWAAVKTFNHTVWDNYDFSDGTWTGDDFWTVTDSVVDGTYYYAVTSLETSGLESQKLSNIKKVVVSGGTGTVTDHTAYPSAPGGKTAFYTTAPDAVQNPSFTYKKSPATADGQYTVEWTAPVNKTLVRYYNIYAKDGSAPTAIQQTRIASVPATAADTSFTYVDWLGNPDGSTKYIVTSVDYQGNESTADAPAEGDAIAPTTTPSKTGRIAGKTSVTLASSEAGTTSYCYGAAVCSPSTNYTGAVTVKPGNYLCFASSDATPNVEVTKCQYYGFPVRCQ